MGAIGWYKECGQELEVRIVRQGDVLHVILGDGEHAVKHHTDLATVATELGLVDPSRIPQGPSVVSDREMTRMKALATDVHNDDVLDLLEELERYGRGEGFRAP